MKKTIYLVLSSLVIMCFSFAIETSKKNEPFFNREEYRKVKDGIKYREPAPLTKFEAKRNKTQNWVWLKYLSYIIVLGAIVFLIYKLILYMYAPDNKKVKTSGIQLQQVDEEPTIASDLELLLEQALKANDFKEAIRIYYLLSIRNLNDNHVLSYTIDKTNYEYLSEVGGHPAFTIFRELTMTFERIWFGDSPANELKLNSYRAKYIDLNEVILSNRKKQGSV